MPSLSEDLKIVISGDPSKFNKAMAEVQAETKRLQAGFSATAKIAGAAFVALTGTVYGLVKAYEEDAKVSKQVEDTLRRTGREAQFTAEELGNMATELQDLTTFQDASVQSAQDMILTFDKVGKTKESFQEVTATALDLATKMGVDASQGARLLGMALQSPEDGLARLRKAGVLFTTEQERMIFSLNASGRSAEAQALIMDAVKAKVDGAAEAAAKGTGGFQQLQNTLGNIASIMGSQLSPFLEAAAGKLNAFLKVLRDNPELVKTAAVMLGIATAIAGLVTGFALLGAGILKVIAIAKALGIVFAGLAITIKGALIASGIGLLIVALTDLAINFDTRVAQIKAVWNGLVTFFTGSAEGLGQIFRGIFNLDVEGIKAGIEQIKNAAVAGAQQTAAEMQAYRDANTEAEKVAAEQSVAIEQDSLNQKLAANVFYLDEMKRIRDERKELEAQEKLTDKELDLMQEAEYQNNLLAMENEYRAMAANTERTWALEKREKELKDQQKYREDLTKHGKMVADINKFYRSQEVQGTQFTLGQLASLQQSHSEKLFKLGKAAAIAQAIMNTAQGATKAFADFGFPFGLIAAAAVTAAGLVQIQTIRSQGMADGGLVMGGVPGKDSVPAMLMPGELVAPARNFDEVVNAVAASRNAQSGTPDQSAGSTVQEVIIGFKDEAFEIIETNLRRRQAIGFGGI